MKKATLPLARHARSRGRSRKRKHSRSFAAAASGECSMTPKKERGIYGMVAGGAIGLAVAVGGFFAVTTKDRALQKAAGAPSPKPGLAAGIAAVGATVGAALGGRFVARRKPTC